MTGRPVMMFDIEDVESVNIKEDPAGITTITLLAASTFDVVLKFPPATLAKLQGILARADLEHARYQAKQ
jgi:hypothetical protein